MFDAVDRILRRHRDDPQLSDASTTPRDVLTWAIAAARRTGGPAAAATIMDALTLVRWCWWDDRHIELQLLRDGKAYGVPLADLGSPLASAPGRALRTGWTGSAPSNATAVLTAT